MKISLFKTYQISSLRQIKTSQFASPTPSSQILNQSTESEETYWIPIPTELQKRILDNKKHLKKDSWHGDTESQKLSELFLKKRQKDYGYTDHLIATQNLSSSTETMRLTAVEMNTLRYMANDKDPYRQIRDYRNIAFTK